MSRVHEYLALIDDPARATPDSGHESDEVLLHLLVELAFSDGVVHGDEFALLQRVRPDLGPSDLMEWAMTLSERPFHDASLRKLVSQGEAPLDVLRFAARMVCLDGDVASEERQRLRVIAEVVGLEADAPDRVIGEIVAAGGPVASSRVMDALRNMLWRVLVPRRGDPEDADLAAAAPTGAEAVCVLDAGSDEVAALYEDGLLARFEDQARFVLFASIARYTRVPVPGAGFHLHTTDGTHLACSDPRMADLGALLDFLYAR